MPNNEVLVTQAFALTDKIGDVVSVRRFKSALPILANTTAKEGLFVHGLPESELRELIERRGVCEWKKDTDSEGTFYKPKPSAQTCLGWTSEIPDFCPSCGRRVSVGG